MTMDNENMVRKLVDASIELFPNNILPEVDPEVYSVIVEASLAACH